ncbi:MAG: XRE family transcriptional regulator [bacterium]
MIKSLNVPAVKQALLQAGMDQTDLAGRIGVSRASVSKWLLGKSVPQPDKLLNIGMLLGLAFEQLVELSVPAAAPIVSFRRKAARVTKDDDLEKAREKGELLKRLVNYVPDVPLADPPVLTDPSCAYDYVQRAAADVRKEMGLKEKIEFTDLIDKFNRLHAVIIPVLWGTKEQHGNALNIHLPDSKTTWVYLNLDSKLVDFKFWMAHELGHSLAPTLGDGDEDGELFADAFAQALLFPETDSERMRNRLVSIGYVGTRVNKIKEEASSRLISPLTIRLAIQAFETARGLEPLNLGDERPFMGAVKNFSKDFPTVTMLLFKTEVPKPGDYAACARKAFSSSFFEALAAFCKAEEGAEHYIRQILDLPLADAKTLSEVLRQ